MGSRNRPVTSVCLARSQSPASVHVVGGAAMCSDAGTERLGQAVLFRALEAAGRRRAFLWWCPFTSDSVKNKKGHQKRDPNLFLIRFAAFLSPKLFSLLLLPNNFFFLNRKEHHNPSVCNSTENQIAAVPVTYVIMAAGVKPRSPQSH